MNRDRWVGVGGLCCMIIEGIEGEVGRVGK